MTSTEDNLNQYSDMHVTDREIPLERFQSHRNEQKLTLDFFRQIQTLQGDDRRPSNQSNEQEYEPPGAFPPKRTKNELFVMDNFEQLSRLVSRVVPKKTETWDQFTDRLMLECGCRNDLDKLRAAFEWVGKSDPDKISEKKEDRIENTPFDIYIRCRKEKLFSALFQRILAYSRLPYELIKGYKKGSTYNVGHSIDKQLDKGLWFAVFVDGEWRFVDAHWGCCHILGVDSGEWNHISESGIEQAKVSQGEIQYSCNEAYFLTDPYKMIFKHFPENPEWQLLKNPISMEQFEELPYMFPDFVENLGIGNFSHWKSVILIPYGKIDICFEELHANGVKNEYKVHLYIHTKSMQNIDTVSYESKELKVSKFMAVKRDGKRMCISVYPPQMGKYLLVIQGCKTGVEHEKLTDLIHYVLHCTSKPKSTVDPLPQPAATEFGLGGKADNIGVTSINHSGAEIAMEEGELEVRKTIKLKSQQDLDYKLELRDRTNDTPLDTNSIVTWKEKDTHSQDFFDYVHVLAPDSGMFGLSIQAANKGSKDYRIVGDYLVESHTNAEDAELVFPKIEEFGTIGFVSPDYMKQFGISAEDSVPYIKTDAPSLVLQWNIKNKKETKLSTRMLRYDGKELIHKDDFSLVSSSENGCDINVRFEDHGVHLLQVFASDGENNDPLNVFNYYIRSCGELNEDILPFPGQSEHWNSNYKINSPLNGWLRENTTQDLAIINEGKAKNMFVKLPSGDKVPLSETNKFQWTNDMPVGNSGQILEVISIDEDGNERMILKFTAASEEEFARRRQEISRKNAKRLERLQNREKKRERYLRKIRGEPEDEKPIIKNEIIDSSPDSSPSKKSDVSSSNMNKLEPDQENSASTSSDTEPDDPRPNSKLERKNKRKKQKDLKYTLKASIQSKKELKIKKAIAACEEYGDFNDADGFLRYAKKYVDLFEHKKKLADAVKKCQTERKCEHIAKALEDIEKANFPSEMLADLDEDIIKAKSAFKRFERISRIKIKPLVLDEKSMLELRNYAAPDPDIHVTVMATLLVLGCYEKKTRKWKRCQPVLKSLRVSDFNNLDPIDVHPAIALRAKELISKLDSSEIAIKSAAAAAFFDWALHLSNSVIDTLEEDDKMKPASIRKQKKILRVTEEEDADIDWEDSGKRGKTASNARRTSLNAKFM